MSRPANLQWDAANGWFAITMLLGTVDYVSMKPRPPEEDTDGQGGTVYSLGTRGFKIGAGRHNVWGAAFHEVEGGTPLKMRVQTTSCKLGLYPAEWVEYIAEPNTLAVVSWDTEGNMTVEPVA